MLGCSFSPPVSAAWSLWLGLIASCAAPAAHDARAAAHENLPPLEPPPGADVKALLEPGQDLPALEAHLVGGKVTIFDFYASWCAPCRKVDQHLYPMLGARQDLAVRKIDIGSWESPVAERWLGDAAELPYLLVYDKRGRKIAALSGGDLRELDRAIAEASR